MTALTKLKTAAAIVATTIAGTAASAEKWDMPMAYAATNFHSEHGVMFPAFRKVMALVVVAR